MKELIRRTFTWIAPETMASIQSARSRAYSHRLIRKWGISALNEKLVGKFGYRVQSGPFQGMMLSPKCRAEHLGPYLLGTYEAELHRWYERLKRGRFNQILDIGAKFGYYASGIALSHSKTPVIAFDPDWWARDAVTEVSTANKISNVLCERLCTPKWMTRNLLANSLIISDCEGYEEVLFSKTTILHYATATILIELHGNIPEIHQLLSVKFDATHNIETVGASSDDPPCTIDLSFLTRDETHTAIREIRGEQSWMLLTPKMP